MLRIIKELFNKKPREARNIYSLSNLDTSNTTNYSLGLSPYREFLMDCYKCSAQDRKTTLDRFNFNYYELDQETFYRDLTAIAQLDATGIDQFVGLIDSVYFCFQYRTTHGKRTFDFRCASESKFEVLSEGDGFARAVARLRPNTSPNFSNNTTLSSKKELKLYSNNYQSPICLDILQEDSYEPLLILGSKGSGKSTLLAGILEQAQESNCPIVGISETNNNKSSEQSRFLSSSLLNVTNQFSFNPFTALNLILPDKDKKLFYRELIECWVASLVDVHELSQDFQDYYVQIRVRNIVDRFYRDPIFQSYYDHNRGTVPSLADFVAYTSQQLQADLDYDLGKILPKHSNFQIILSRLEYWLKSSIASQLMVSEINSEVNPFIINVPDTFDDKDSLVLAFATCFAAFKQVLEYSQTNPRSFFFIDGSSTLFQFPPFVRTLQYFYTQAPLLGVKLIISSQQPLVSEFNRGQTLIGRVEPSLVEEFKQAGYDEGFLDLNAVKPLVDRASYSSWCLFSANSKFINLSDCFCRYYSS